MNTGWISAVILAAMLGLASGLQLTPGPRMQTSAPVKIPDTFTVPDALPSSWTVPDTFSISVRKSEEPPFFRVTLFKSSNFDAEFATTMIIKVVGHEESHARNIASQTASVGFGVVGEWVEEVAEMYAEGLQSQGFTVDVSEAAK